MLGRMKVCTVSATRRWQLTELVDRMVEALPDRAKFGFVQGTEKQHVSDNARQLGNESAVKTMLKAIGVVAGTAIIAVLLGTLAARAADRD